jgi:putative transcriptional regulator
MDLAPGVLLVAEPAILDPNFKRAVILLCEHDDEASFGLTINRPSKLFLPEVLTEPVGLEHQLFLGGPVQPDTLHFLHVYSTEIEEAQPVIDGVGWGGPFDEVAEQIRSGTFDPQGFRFFAGYTGWGAGQLAEELAEGTWIVFPGSREQVFDHPPESLWRELITSLGGEMALLVNFPDEPQLN